MSSLGRSLATLTAAIEVEIDRLKRQAMRLRRLYGAFLSMGYGREVGAFCQESVFESWRCISFQEAGWEATGRELDGRTWDQPPPMVTTQPYQLRACPLSSPHNYVRQLVADRQHEKRFGNSL